MRIILLGPPGSGKGTIADELHERFSFVHVSTGDLFRSNIKNQTPLGLEIRSYMEAGSLVPDELTIRLVEDVMTNGNLGDHFLLDGFPRTVRQAELFDQFLTSRSEKIDAVVHVYVPDDLIKERLRGRRVCLNCGKTYHVPAHPPEYADVCNACTGLLIQRKDDNADVVAHRLEIYHKETAPLVDYYQKRGLIVDIDNSGKFADVMLDLSAKLKLG